MIRLTSPSRFIRNIGWIGMTEMVSRASRLITVIVLARFLSTGDYGLAAIALTTNELVKVLTNTGIGQRIIQSGDEQLGAVCNTAWKMNWVVCIGLFILQCAIAPIIGLVYDDMRLAWMVAAMAGVYLMMPLGLVQCFLVQRESRMGVLAFVATAQMTIDNILTAILAAGGLGAWAVVLPKLLVGPVWVVGMVRARKWRFDPAMGGADWREILSFGRSVLGVEVLKTLRLYADRLIIGAVLGLDAVGLYFFAFSAGLGLSLSFVNAFGIALFPHLCEIRDDVAELRRRWLNALKLAAKVAVPVILAQAALSPFYVPLIYGQRWAEAVPVLALLCLSAIPRPFAEAAGQLLRAQGRPGLELGWSVGFTVLYLAAVTAALPWGIPGIAVAVCAVHWLVLPAMTLWVAIRILPPSLPLAQEAAE
ncbi:lipopolysaccharide biosynthesis protein [Magnetospirillum sp. SS-4]|uniref:lipopolysaccharide biosynthesis protein n=1 Tax=Magnetospirillum sp. SS-4 TaxID=2681465 RepID=UPI001383B109|nr:lipopolysaccharide biosynthesis protein [Magnetospirillum sp. SS-4]CAA7621940.1 Polysaccharide biosynthesis protein [Magnetospirillum sp. SS-4]